jgi:hypothetical protein
LSLRQGGLVYLVLRLPAVCDDILLSLAQNILCTYFYFYFYFYFLTEIIPIFIENQYWQWQQKNKERQNKKTGTHKGAGESTAYKKAPKQTNKIAKLPD